MFASTEQAQAVLNVIMARYNEIIAQLDRGPEGLEPVFWIHDGGETVIAADWAEGFFEAMNLRAEAWAPLIRDKTNGIMLAPILALCWDDEGEPLLPMDETEATRWRTEAPELIPRSVFVIRKFWREHAAAGPFSGPTRSEPKVGRNEACPLRIREKVQVCTVSRRL